MITGPLTVATIVLSYDRPRMLREALDSIKGADEVILLDDASHFDARALADEFKGKFKSIRVKVASPLDMKARKTTPRLGKAINEAIRGTECRIITYLCDDDLFAPNWIEDVRQFFGTGPDHFVYGRWNVFTHGESPGDAPCPLEARWKMTTGNFAHLRKCSFRHDCWWDEAAIAVHDSWFLGKAFKAHPLSKIRSIPSLAGWRREHPFNMVHFTDGRGYTKKADGVLDRGSLE